MIAITFPEGFVLSQDTEVEFYIWTTGDQMPSVGNIKKITMKVIEHEDSKKMTALITRVAKSAPQIDEDTQVLIQLTNIRNPQVSGLTQNFEIRTSRAN